MSISRIALLAAIVLSLANSVACADDLAAAVAAKMKASGALKGYHVNVKSKAGTVWLEGTVTNAQAIDTALAAAESVAGVERVVNRLSVTPQASGGEAFSLPSSIRSLVGMPSPAPVQLPVEEVSPMAEPAEFLAGGEGMDAERRGVELTQAVGPDATLQAPAPMKPLPASRQAGPRPIRAQAAKPVPQPRQSAAAGRVQRTSMKKQYGGEPLVDGQTLELPGSGEGYVVGDQGGYSQAGGLTDGQMVPGSMRVTEGPSGGYCPPGQGGMGPGGMGGPMPMGGGGMGGAGGMGGPGGMAVPVRGNGPNMPNYAWPSYASYPNYAALQYPTQYSPTAWPYIGPFYPYPQVPLGWRRVSLEWDDGWWWVDFDERHVHSHHR